MKEEETFQRMVQLMVEKVVKASVTVGIVKSVDTTKKTCHVTREGNTELLGVRLNAIVKDFADRVLIYPKVNSPVLCIMLENDPTQTYLLSCSEVESIEVTIGSSSFVIRDGEIILNGGSLGGMVILEKALSNLESIKEYVEAIHQALPTAFTAIGAGSAANGPAGATSYTNAMDGKSITLEDMENTAITQ